MELTAPKFFSTPRSQSMWFGGFLCLFASATVAQDQPEIRVYGALNQAFLKYNDGLNSINYGRVDSAVGDNVNRIGVEFDRNLSSSWGMTGTFELGFAPKPSNQVNQLDLDYSDGNFDVDSLRKFELAFSNPDIGTIYVGQGDMTGQGSAPDFSGTSVISSTNPAELAGGNFWRLYPSNELTTRQINESFDNFDSGRRLRIRYNTPDDFGIYFSASVGREVLTSGDDSTYVDVAAIYEKQWEKYGLAVEFSAKGQGHNEYAGGAGFAFIHKPSGLNISASASHTSYGTHYGIAKIGLKRKIVSFGTTAISLDLYNGGSFVRHGTESLSNGLALVQSIDSLNMDVYLIVRTYIGYTNIGLPNEDFATSKASAIGFNWVF